MGKRVKVGDLVTRPSYGGDIVFRVVKIDETKGIALLRASDTRLMADAPLGDLEIFVEGITDGNVRFRQLRMQELIRNDNLRRQRNRGILRAASDYGQISGTVLHLDGDRKYLQQCLAKYDELKITANGYYIDEAEQPLRVKELLLKHRPDILVITGHDGMKRTGGNNLSDYYSSSYFVESVLKARETEPDKDSLIIFAGACQSFYEAMIAAGANFASAPKRININIFDPVQVAQMMAETSVKEIISIAAVIEHSITGIEGIGGIESRGKMRLSLPKITT